MFFLASYKRHVLPILDFSALEFESSLVFLTAISITGWALIFSPLPVLCHICRLEVQATDGVMSSSLLSSLISLHLYTPNLQILSISPKTWLQKPPCPATQEQYACFTAAVTIHNAIFKLCGESFFL